MVEQRIWWRRCLVWYGPALWRCLEMSIDVPSVLARLKMVLPARWFADSSPILDALLTGIASSWVSVFSLLDGVGAQARIATANGIFLDIAAQDYFGEQLPRRV